MKKLANAVEKEYNDETAYCNLVGGFVVFLGGFK